MKRVICSSEATSAQSSMDAFQNRIDELQTVKDKLEAKSDTDNADKIKKVISFFVDEIDKMMGTYMKTVYDSNL